MEQANRDRRHVALAQRFADAYERRFVKWGQHVSAMVDAFAYRQPIVARDERARPFDEEVVDFAAILTSDFDEVAKSFGSDERHPREFESELAQQCIRRDRGRMRQKFNRRFSFVLRKQGAQRLDYRALRL